jgi:fido (protein-threonine AMPylation protein)
MSALLELPEVFAASAAPRSTVSDALGRGELRRLTRGLYTRNLTDPPELVVRRNLWDVVAALYPGALIADRSARLGRPADDGSLFLVHDRASETQVAGLLLRPRSGHPPLEEDLPFPAGLHMSSVPRALLENAALSRGRHGRVPRTLTRPELEEWLESLIDQRDEEGFRALREQVRTLAPRLGLEDELAVLDPLMGAVLGTRRVRAASPRLRARQKGFPYDANRVDLFDVLFTALDVAAPIIRPVLDPDAPRYRFLPFFEAYFSNFIEGTEFAVEEARAIVFDGVIPPARPEDAHDVIGTYRLVSDRTEMSRVPADGDELIALLKSRHRVLLEGRPEKHPGVFKTEANRVGNVRFIAPTLVEGTLRQGFNVYRRLTSPFARAVFQMFLISEVHPFDDGNGRIARVMMNAELVAASEQRIIVPQVYRNNYLMALRALTVNRRAEALIATLDFAQRYTTAIDYSNFEGTQAMLEETNAFRDPAEADAAGVRLVLPSSRAISGS